MIVTLILCVVCCTVHCHFVCLYTMSVLHFDSLLLAFVRVIALFPLYTHHTHVHTHTTHTHTHHTHTHTHTCTHMHTNAHKVCVYNDEEEKTKQKTNKKTTKKNMYILKGMGQTLHLGLMHALEDLPIKTLHLSSMFTKTI